VLFKGTVVFRQCIPKTHKLFGIDLYKVCDYKEYTYNVTMCSGKDRNRVTASLTSTLATVTGLSARIGNVGHKLYMDILFSSLALFDDLHTKMINCCGLLDQREKGCQKNFGHKMKLKRDDLKTKVKCNITAIAWKDKLNVNILTNMHSPTLKCNFCDERGKAVKLAII